MRHARVPNAVLSQPVGQPRRHWLVAVARGSRAVLMLLVVSVLVPLLAGCATHPPIEVDSHVFKVKQLRESIASQIETEIRTRGFNVSRSVSEGSNSVELGSDTVNDFDFTVQGPDYTAKDFIATTNSVRDDDRPDPIALRSTRVWQEFGSASGTGSAGVTLTLSITENARAYFKKDDRAVDIEFVDGAATFNYNRAEDEEYVDIYILPAGADREKNPKNFRRISLFAPFESRLMDWEPPWYVRIWRSIFGE